VLWHCWFGRASTPEKKLVPLVSNGFSSRATTTTILRPFFQDYPGEPAPKENFWTLWCKGRLTEADTLTIQLGARGQMPFLPPNQQCQSTEGN